MRRPSFSFSRLAGAIAAFALTLGASVVWAQSGARIAAQLCSACHGAHGNSQSPMFPKLNGQTHDYLVNQLKGFRQHVRGETDARAYMWAIASQLDDATVDSLADYFSHEPPSAGAAGDAALIAKGEQVFKQGVPDNGVPACASCHGAEGQGAGQFPRLAGQHEAYLLRQIDVFRNGARANAPVMTTVAHALTPDQAKAVAAYLQSR